MFICETDGRLGVYLIRNLSLHHPNPQFPQLSLLTPLWGLRTSGPWRVGFCVATISLPAMPHPTFERRETWGTRLERDVHRGILSFPTQRKTRWVVHPA